MTVRGVEGADLVPGSGLRWPKCECGQSICPDGKGSGTARGGAGSGALSARVAERNKWSGRGGA